MLFFKLEWKRIFTVKLVGVAFACIILTNYFQLRDVRREYHRQLITVDYLKMAQPNLRLEDGVNQLKKVLPVIDDYEEVELSKIPPMYRQTFSYLQAVIEEEVYSRGTNFKDMLLLKNPSGASMSEPEEKRMLNFVIGYAEGWKNLQKDYKKYLTVILCITALVLNFVYTMDEEKNTLNVLQPTFKGLAYLHEHRLYFGEILAGVIYLFCMTVFYVVRMEYFGISGYQLLIQSDPLQMDAMLRITFLQQAFLNFILGWIIMEYWAVLILIVSKRSKSFIRGLTSVLSVIVMNFLGEYLYFKHPFRFFRFFPFYMIQNQNYYKTDVAGTTIPKIGFLFIIAFFGFIILHYSFLLFIRKQERGINLNDISCGIRKRD